MKLKKGDIVVCVSKINPHSDIKIGEQYTLSADESRSTVWLEGIKRSCYSSEQFILMEEKKPIKIKPLKEIIKEFLS